MCTDAAAEKRKPGFRQTVPPDKHEGVADDDARRPGPARARRGLLVAALLLGHAATALARPAAEPALARVASALREARAAATATVLAPTLPALRLGAGEAVVELRFSTLSPAVVERAVALGARPERVSLRYARLVASVPLAALGDLAALPDLTAIHPLYGAQTGVGAVETQVGEALAVASLWRSAGVDGSGVRVGLLSDSLVNRHGGRLAGDGCARVLTGAAPQASGDLPPSMVVLDPGPRSGADEGTGMGEIVHDLAPGASLLFASAFPDEATFAENITALRACGADVIVDDVLFFAEPMFQDGIIAQAADAAAADGALLLSAAANASDAGIDQLYRDSDPRDDEANPPVGVDFHDFGNGTPYTAVTVPKGCDLRATLQWNEPFAGTLGAGARSDLDLYVYAAPPPGARILASSTNTQGCSANAAALGDPLEIAYFRNSGSTPRTVYLAVDHVCGDESVRLRIALSSTLCVLGVDGYGLERGPFGGPALYGHPAAAGVLAVAAIDYREIASQGDFAAPAGIIDAEPFSARGGALPFYLDGAGAPLPGAPLLRDKPELAAPDGGNTAFFGTDVDHDGFLNFFGTSAAAPAVAAVAALLMEAAPQRPAAAIGDALRASARDVSAPGADADTGAGLIDPLAALALVETSPPGDCDGSGRVTIDELIAGVRIALGEAPLATCAALDDDGDGVVGIAELIAAVGLALE